MKDGFQRTRIEARGRLGITNQLPPRRLYVAPRSIFQDIVEYGFETVQLPKSIAVIGS